GGGGGGGGTGGGHGRRGGGEGGRDRSLLRPATRVGSAAEGDVVRDGGKGVQARGRRRAQPVAVRSDPPRAARRGEVAVRSRARLAARRRRGHDQPRLLRGQLHGGAGARGRA